MNEWDNEPDEWEGEMMYMRRHPDAKHWCGYVAVPESHPLFGKDYNATISVPQEIIDRPIDIDKIGAINLLCAAAKDMSAGQLEIVLAFDVHGGLTFSDNHRPGHDPDGLWWFGFDCAHAGDLSPGYPSTFVTDETYRNFEYVQGEVLSLARQLARWKQPA